MATGSKESRPTKSIEPALRGVYTPRQVSMLVNLRLGSSFSATTFRQWSYGYVRRGRVYGPVIRADYSIQAHILSFADFLDLMFVAALRRRRISLPVAREVVRRAAAKFESDHPFALRRFRTDGRSIFADLEGGEASELDLPGSRMIEALHWVQMILPDLVEPYIGDIDWGEIEAQAYWPCGRDSGIVLDPRRSFGQPIDAETGIPTEALYSFFLAGDAPQVIADRYEIPVDTVERAVTFEWLLCAA